jgi:hypothetical protein
MGQAHLAMAFSAQPSPWSISAQGETREVFSPVGTGDLPMKSGRPVGYGRVAGEQADGVTDWFSGRREGRGSPKSFSAAEKRRWQARVGVTGGVRAVEEEVLGGAVLGVGSR